MTINLRRGDFEAMHPKAKLFGFDECKKLYTGDGVESINDQWATWCACIAMLYLEAKAKAVPEGFVVVEKKLIKTLHEELLDHEPDSFVVIRDICELWEQAEAQGPANDN